MPSRRRKVAINLLLGPGNVPLNLKLLLFADKIEDARAKAAIKAQIEADKKARAEKFAREKAIRDGQPVPDNAASTSAAPGPAAAAAPASGVAGKDFKETRLQIRMVGGGQPYTTTLSSEASAFSFSTCTLCLRVLTALRQLSAKLLNFWQDRRWMWTWKQSRLHSIFRGRSTFCRIIILSHGSLYYRKTFSRGDFSRTLKDLGLTPSAVCI